MAAAATPRVSPQQLNAMQRQAVLGQAVEMMQQIYTQVIPAATAPGTVMNINPRNVGLIKRFIIIVSGTTKETAGTAGTVSPLGWSNLLSQITFTDLNNNIRVQTGGWHLSALATARHRRPYAGAVEEGAYSLAGGTPVLDTIVQRYGNNFPVIVAPQTIKLSTSGQKFRIMYDLPLAYSDDDLRGAVYANVVNAVMQIGLTINANPFVAAGTDNTFAVADGGTCLFDGPLTVTVYQVYLDQLPIGKQGVVLPILDLSTVYELKSTLFSSIVAANDFPIPYANFRDFLSTFAVFNSTGLDTNPGDGSDVNYWALQSANFTNLWKLDPLTAAFMTRQIIGLDMPSALYYFSHRRKPISTMQYGNMELILNAKAVSGVPYVSVGWEDFALVNTLTQAGSLAG